MKKNRSELYTELTEELKKWSLQDVKLSMIKRYNGETKFDRLSLDQVEDLLRFLRSKSSGGLEVCSA